MSSPTTADVHILAAFLKSGQSFVSGESLAENLGVSRVSIWNRMKKLEEAGFQFQAVRNRGYQLQSEPGIMHPALLCAYARHMDLHLPLHTSPSIDSTSDEVERLLIEGANPPFAVVASEQTKGRGRLGRTWESPSCGNIYLSLAIQPTIEPKRMQTFTLWMGINLATLIAALTGLPIQIKWPNDLLCRGKKIAGMLTEARIDNDHIKDLVFGLGLNANAREKHFPNTLATKASSLRIEANREFSLHRMTIQIIKCLLEAWKKLERQDISPLLLKHWPPLDCLKDKPIMLTNGNQSMTGTARGINCEGCLILEEEDGAKREIRSGDISIQNAYPRFLS